MLHPSLMQKYSFAKICRETLSDSLDWTPGAFKNALKFDSIEDLCSQLVPRMVLTGNYYHQINGS